MDGLVLQLAVWTTFLQSLNWQFLIVSFFITYAFTIMTDLGRTVLEVFFNFIRKPGYPPLVYLTPEECAVVIPCHNSADCIADTLKTLPSGYRIVCVANACTDDTISILRELAQQNLRLSIIVTENPGKIRAVMLGVLWLKRVESYSHFLLLDDDVEWPQLLGKPFPISVYDKEKSTTALPVVPTAKDPSWVRSLQVVEYQMMCASKRAQGNLGNVIMASGAAGIYRVETFIEAMQEHDGEHIGDDLQCSYIHHCLGMKIDFNSECVVKTHPPSTLRQWWRQRAKRWEASPVFNSVWAFKIIFAPFGKRSPGWWIRGITLYRKLVIVNDIMRCISFPVVLVTMPWAVFGVWAITYCSAISKMLTFRYFFKNENYVRVDPRTVLSVLTYPLYGALMWLSRVWATPKGVYLAVKYHLRGVRLTSKFSYLQPSLEAEVTLKVDEERVTA